MGMTRTKECWLWRTISTSAPRLRRVEESYTVETASNGLGALKIAHRISLMRLCLTF